MSDPQKPNRRPQSAEELRQQAAVSRETNRPTDSIPVVAGQFVNLPAMFGRYQVEKLLGRGAMGAVYLATDTQLDRPVALKIPKVAASGSKRLLQRLETEAKAAAKLDHPSLCKVFDAGAVGEQCFIAMQYIEGETLKSQLEAKGKSAAEAVSLILQLAEGLSEAHALGVIHRDLKPENIMINRRGTPVIMDFGLAKFSTIGGNAAATQAGTILGSPAYMSPEQASGNSKEIDQRSDIYSLGAILFEMLTGQWPFSGSAMQILGQKSLLDAPGVRTIQPDLPPQLAATCDKMLAKDPLDRYQDLAEVIADLQRIDFDRSPMSVGRLPQPVRIPSEIGEYAVLEPADVRIAPIDKRLQNRLPRISRSTASPTWLQQLQGWWDGRPPAIKWTMLGGAGALLVMLGVILLIPTRNGTLQIEIDDPTLAVRFDGQSVLVENGLKTISVTPTDQHKLEFLQDGVTLESATRELTLKRGEKRLVTFKLLDGKASIDGQPVSLERKAPPADVARNNPAQSVPLQNRIVEPTTAPSAGSAGHQWPAEAPKPAIAPFNKDQAKAYQEAWAKYLKVDVEYTNSIGMKFRLIPPGEFLMGSTPVEVAIQAAGGNEYWRKFIHSEAPQHRVILTQPVYLGIHEVTQGQFQRVMSHSPSWFTAMGGGKGKISGQNTVNFPVEIVSWNDAAEFCTKLSRLEELQPYYGPAGERLKPQGGDGYRLPTEAEWEFACRAGTTRNYWSGDREVDLGIAGWFPANSQQRTHTVGELVPNPFGLYDVHGNVGEWVEDWWESTYYRQFQTESAINPDGPAYTLPQHVVKGGSWYEAPTVCRSASRHAQDSTARSHDIGFRVMLTVNARHNLSKAAANPSSKNATATPVVPPPVVSLPVLKVAEVTDPPAPPAAVKRPQIPADVTLFRTKRYKVFTESLSWHEARQKCLDLGGRLADVRNAYENTFLTKLAVAQNVDTVWLGATDEVTEGRWLWSDGKEMKYQNWCSVGGKQPNNKGNGEHYLIMSLKFATGEWHDQPARPTQYKPGYICEWDKPTVAATTDNGWKSVFNGKNLGGWTPMLSSGDGQDIATHRPATTGWIVRDEELVCNTSEPGWLKLDKIYGDCEIDFEFYLPRESNSGLLVRCPERGGAFRIDQYEIQLEHDTSPQVKSIQKCGGISGIVAPSELAFKPGAWNHLNVSLRQDRIQVRLNDKLVVDTAIADHHQLQGLPKDGNFGLFNWKGLAIGCKFRKIRIKEFKPDVPQEFISTATGLKYRLLRTTKGKLPRVGDKVLVNYRGTLDDGTEFDTSYGKQPVSFALPDVIRGWMEGMQYCPVGGKIELEIPPTLGYGEKGTGSIPGGATLHFTIELLKIQ